MDGKREGVEVFQYIIVDQNYQLAVGPFDTKGEAKAYVAKAKEALELTEVLYVVAMVSGFFR